MGLYAAGVAFEKLTGRDIYEALETDLARPLGMQDFSRARQEKHDMAPASRFPEYAMYLSARDMARLGLLMLHRGNWNGKQIVPADWVDEITTLVTPQSEIKPRTKSRSRRRTSAPAARSPWSNRGNTTRCSA